MHGWHPVIPNRPSITKVIYSDFHDEIKFRTEQRRFQTFRDKAHFYFDKIWQNKLMKRDEAYEWLANMLGVPEPFAHFSKMHNERCIEAIYFCQQFLNDNRRLDLDFGAEPITPYYVLEDPSPQLKLF